MKSALFAAALALVACGGGQPKPQLAPLPEDPKPAEPVAQKPEEPKPPPEPPAPTGPIEVALPAQQTTVKLISKGRGGKPQKIRYPGKVGDKQKIELALDFGSTETLGADTRDTNLPTMVLAGEVETKAVEGEAIDHAIAISAIDLRDAPGAAASAERTKELQLVKTALSSLSGLVIGARMGATGAPREIKLRIEKPDGRSGGALELIQLTLPVLPVLPKEPIALGAKWQTTTMTKLADKIEIKVVTDYEVTAAKAGAWTVKGKTAVSGADQSLDGAKITKIKGAGTSEMEIGTGLYPRYKSAVAAEFTAGDQGQTLTIAYRLGGEISWK